MVGIKSIVFLLALVVMTVLSSCDKGEISADDFYAWHDNEENGYHRITRLGDLQLDLKYLPLELLLFNEENGQVMLASEKDSLKGLYMNNMNFVLTIGPAEDAKDKFDITKVGVANYDEFAERALQLNFEMRDHITLRSGNRTWKAALCEMENVYGLSFHRTFNIVFTPTEKLEELRNLEEFTLTVDDEIFGSGRTSFRFDRNQLAQVPTIIKR